MKRLFFFLPMLGLPALGHYFVPYLTGRGFIPESSELILDLSVTLLLPFAIAVVFAILPSSSSLAGLPGLKRAALFIIGLMVQFGFLSLSPGSAEVQMRGLTQRYRHEFSAQQLRAIANEIRKSESNGTLVFIPFSNVTSMTWNDARLLDISQLPANLQGRFQSIRLSKRRDEGSEIIFELAPDRGILCSTNSYKNDFWKHSMDDGVYAYRYMRH